MAKIIVDERYKKIVDEEGFFNFMLTDAYLQVRPKNENVEMHTIHYLKKIGKYLVSNIYFFVVDSPSKNNMRNKECLSWIKTYTY